MIGNQDSTKYFDLLGKNLLPFSAITHGKNWTNQQDNAAILRSAKTKSCFSEKMWTFYPGSRVLRT